MDAAAFLMGELLFAGCGTEGKLSETDSGTKVGSGTIEGTDGSDTSDESDSEARSDMDTDVDTDTDTGSEIIETCEIGNGPEVTSLAVEDNPNNVLSCFVVWQTDVPSTSEVYFGDRAYT